MFTEKSGRSWAAATTALLVSVWMNAAIALAAPAPIPALNLATQAEADTFAREIVARYKAEAKAKGVEPAELDPILIVHIGSPLPEQLQWIMLHLESAKIPAKLERITEEEMATQFKSASRRALSDAHYLTYDPVLAKKRKVAMREIFRNAMLKTRQIFGVPHGFTAWVRLNRSPKLKLIEGSLATINSFIAGSSVAYTFYLAKHLEGAEVHPLRAGIFLAGWVWFTLYEGRRFSEVMTQAKVVKETEPGLFKPTNSRLFTYAATSIRSVISNAIVMSSAFGIEALGDTQRFEHSMWNSTINMFARGWVDEWLSKKMPTLKTDGSIVVEPGKGQWSLQKWTIINSIWNVAYGFGKNIHLLALGNSVDYVYYAMGAIGVIKVVYDERYNIKHRLKRLSAAITGAQVEICETLILGR